ncbi:unnamed protein product [Tenebrio molitor]|nr:unnamed protein product [Tenebrio molitor]
MVCLEERSRRFKIHQKMKSQVLDDVNQTSRFIFLYHLVYGGRLSFMRSAREALSVFIRIDEGEIVRYV